MSWRVCRTLEDMKLGVCLNSGNLLIFSTNMRQHSDRFCQPDFTFRKMEKSFGRGEHVDRCDDSHHCDTGQYRSVTSHSDILTVGRVLESCIFNILNLEIVSWMNESYKECLFRSSDCWSSFPCWPSLNDSSSQFCHHQILILIIIIFLSHRNKDLNAKC
jgi:hypothetical protein